MSYANSLVMTDWTHLEIPTVERLSCRFQGVSKIMPPLLIPTGSVLAVKGTLWSQPPPARGKGSPKRTPYSTLWFFLRGWGRTQGTGIVLISKQEARIPELQGKTAAKRHQPRRLLHQLLPRQWKATSSPPDTEKGLKMPLLLSLVKGLVV